MQHYNLIRNTMNISSESGPDTEPVSLEEMKDYLRLNGFIDDNDSTTVEDFDDDDDLIEELISTARQSLEQTLGISIIEHTWMAEGVTNTAGHVRLRFGPVTAITSIEDSEGEAYDHTDSDIVKLSGDFLKYPRDCDMTVEYTAGYENVPAPILTEIKRMVAYMYENRGDADGLEGYRISSSVFNYSRVPCLE